MRAFRGSENVSEPRPSERRRHIPSVALIGVAGLLAMVIVSCVVYAGLYNIGADAPHTRPVF